MEAVSSGTPAVNLIDYRAMTCIAAGDRAFGLMELLVSLTIISLAILLTVGIFLSGVKGMQKGQDLSAGTLVASSVLAEEFFRIQNGEAAIDSATFFSQDTPVLTGQRVAGTTTFDYEIRHKLIRDVHGDPIGERLTENRLKKVDILVSWSGGKSAGQGKLEVALSKLVSQRDFQ